MVDIIHKFGTLWGGTVLAFVRFVPKSPKRLTFHWVARWFLGAHSTANRIHQLGAGCCVAMSGRNYIHFQTKWNLPVQSAIIIIVIIGDGSDVSKIKRQLAFFTFHCRSNIWWFYYEYIVRIIVVICPPGRRQWKWVSENCVKRLLIFSFWTTTQLHSHAHDTFEFGFIRNRMRCVNHLWRSWNGWKIQRERGKCAE